MARSSAAMALIFKKKQILPTSAISVLRNDISKYSLIFSTLNSVPQGLIRYPGLKTPNSMIANFMRNGKGLQLITYIMAWLAIIFLQHLCNFYHKGYTILRRATQQYHIDKSISPSCYQELSTNFKAQLGMAVYPKNFHDSSDICPMGFIYSIQICEISHRTFGPSHRKCPMCPMIFMNTGMGSDIMVIGYCSKTKPTACSGTCLNEILINWYVYLYNLNQVPSNL